MQSSQGGHQRRAGSLQASTLAPHVASSAARTRSDDSWVEIASQPSSSSLSSATDDIVTTGLRIQQQTTARRRRRTRNNRASPLKPTSGPLSAVDTSSQEEYEESESESDQVMTSSNEGLAMPAIRIRNSSSGSEAATDDEDENRTAVNDPINNCFTPQPNAFSHPPASQYSRNILEPVPGSYFPNTAARPTRPSTRDSFSTQEARVQHSPYNMIAPSHNAAAHHDEALRASLTTLLSCAAAARGLPKSRTCQAAVPTPGPSNRIEPSSLRLVPESALPGRSSTHGVPEPTFNPTIRRHSASTSASADSRPVTKDVNKRKAGAGRSSSKDRRAVKKRRSSSVYSTDEVFVTPTLLTWVVGAGVFVVLSALSFTAGYSIGKEAGKLEAGLGAGADVGACSKEAGRTALGLRRLRFVSAA